MGIISTARYLLLAIGSILFLYGAIKLFKAKTIKEKSIWIPLVSGSIMAIIAVVSLMSNKGNDIAQDINVGNITNSNVAINQTIRQETSLQPELVSKIDKLVETTSDLRERERLIQVLEEKLIELQDELKKKGETEALENFEKGDFGKAEELFKKEAKQGKEKASNALYYLGNIELAKLNFKRALDFYEKAIKESPENSLYLNAAGFVKHTLGDDREAIKYHNQALSIDKNAYGENDLRIAAHYNNLGSSWLGLGEYDKANEYYEKALAISRIECGDEQLCQAIILNNLGLSWNSAGNHKKAIEYFEQALSIDTAAYGAMHPNLAPTYNNLGLAWDDLGEYNKAIGYYNQAFSIYNSTYGENYPKVAVIYNNLGFVWYKLKDYKMATEYLERALAIERNFYSEEHPYIATSLNNIGLALEGAGKHKKAIEYYNKALTIGKKIYGEEHPSIAITLNNIGHSYNSLGEHKRAITFFEQSIGMLSKFYDKDHKYIKSAKDGLQAARAADSK